MYPFKGVLMKNTKYFFIGLLLSASVSGVCQAECSPSWNCDDVNKNCASDCKVSCNISTSCNEGCSFSTASTSYCGYSSTNCEYTNYRPGYILRPFTADNTLELAVFDYDVYHRAERGEDRPMVDFQATYFHRGSRSKTTGAGLFLGKNSFVVKQDGTGDINSAWLNLLNDGENGFDSTFSYNPKYKVDGAYLGARFDLSDWACGLWGSVSSAFVRIKNTVKVCEDLRVAGNVCNDCCDSNISVAGTLGNRLGLTSNASNGQMFIDDVQFKLGYDHYIGDDNHIGIYLVGLAPTRRSQTDYTTDGELAFAHLISGRGSFGVGLNTDWTAWSCNDHSLNWLMDLKYRYIFRGFENRHFDLNNGPLSGYVLQGVNDGANLDSFSLVDALTLPVKVTPGSTVDFWTALHYQFCNYGIEFGYDLFWIGQEKVTLRKNLVEGLGIFDYNSVLAGNVAISDTANALITGTDAHDSDAVFAALANENLSFASATTKRAISHKFYLALSHEKEYFCGPVNMSVGGEYEYASKSQPIISQWGLFIKSSMNY